MVCGMSLYIRHTPPPLPGPLETARYTEEMLVSLRKIAIQQKQELLAHLLALAELEAKSLGASQSQDTLLPG